MVHPFYFANNNIKLIVMNKELYEAPEVQVIEMEVQGMIAESPGDGTVNPLSGYPSGGDGFTY